VQFRIDQKMTGESFPTVHAANQFGQLVDRVGGREARKILQSRQNKAQWTPTFADFTAQYLDPASGIVTGIQPDTRDEYARIAETHLIPRLGEIPIDQISKVDVGRWVAWMEAQPSGKYPDKLVAAKTVQNTHAVLSNILRASVERGLRMDNPAFRTRLSRGTPEEPVFLSREEFAVLYDAVPEYYKPVVAFLVGSQLRWSEATALYGSDLRRDTIPPTVRVTKAWKKKKGGLPYIGTTKTNRGRRTVSLWAELVDLIDTPANPDDFLFRGKMGGKLWYGGFMTRIWNPSVARSGILSQPTPHDLRHTGASWLIADGMPLPYIQARLGHESITTTINTYGHLLPDAHTQMADSLRGTLSGVVPLREIAP
jgi:integrase